MTNVKLQMRALSKMGKHAMIYLYFNGAVKKTENGLTAILPYGKEFVNLLEFSLGCAYKNILVVTMTDCSRTDLL